VSGKLIHVSASTNYLWGVNKANQIYKCARPCTGKWILVEGSLKQVDASDDEVLGVNKHDEMARPLMDLDSGPRAQSCLCLWEMGTYGELILVTTF